MTVQMGHFMFFYPFSYRTHDFEVLVEMLCAQGYQFYKNEKNKLDDDYYNGEVTVSHEKLRQYFYPSVEDKLFNSELSLISFNRFSKEWKIDALLQTHIEQIRFRLFSTDVHLCPFGIGILVLRTKIEGPISFDGAMQFAHRFRELNKQSKSDLAATITTSTDTFPTVQHWIHEEIVRHLESYYVDYSYLGENASKMPFFEDDRMYVNHYTVLTEENPLTDKILFRAGQLNGYGKKGEPYIASSDDTYIAKYVKKKLYTRWAPTDQLITTIHATAHMTTKQTNEHLAAFYGTNFYTILLHYFYKLMMLKLSFEHSELTWEKDLDIVEELIEEITKFSSRYFFIEVSVRTEGKELSQLLSNTLRIEEQHRSIKRTLDELYRVQEDQARDRQSELLFILTIFSTISGLFGMNLVIETFQEKFSWSALSTFTFLEWSAFILTIVGVGIATMLVGHKLYALIRQYYDKKIRNQKR